MSSDPAARPAAANGRPAPPVETTPDPYPVEAKRTAALVFARAFGDGHWPGRKDADALRPPDWFFAFQSQGVAGGPWIGPTVEDTLKAIAAEGYPGVILQPIGFLCDHVEILYDIDVAFQQTAHELNLRLFRAESLNGSALLTDAIAGVLKPFLDRAAVEAIGVI
jgi:ferrochelatase